MKLLSTLALASAIQTRKQQSAAQEPELVQKNELELEQPTGDNLVDIGVQFRGYQHCVGWYKRYFLRLF